MFGNYSSQHYDDCYTEQNKLYTYRKQTKNNRNMSFAYINAPIGL